MTQHEQLLYPYNRRQNNKNSLVYLYCTDVNYHQITYRIITVMGDSYILHNTL